MLSDIELVELFLAGNKDAFKTLHSRYYDKIWFCCCGIVKNKSVADDLTQDTFMQILCNLKNFRKDNFRGWVLRIASNIAINELKRIRRIEKKSRSQLNPNDIQSTTKNDPLEILENKEKECLLLNALEELPELTRKCVIERYCHGISCTDIAETHQIGEWKVRHRLHNGLQFLRKKLEGLI